MTASPLHLPLALALERRPDASGSGRPLSPAEAERFAQLVAQDLARLVPGVERLDLALSAACHDPAELLRPGWPLHAALGELAARAPGSREAGGRIIAFGRAPEGFAAPALEPDASLGGGPLQLVPILLSGDPDHAAALGDVLERDLIEHGMAGAATALQVQEAMGLPLEHARYLTLNDLCAMTAMHYGHAGMESLWLLLESALFSPDRGYVLDAEDSPPALLRDGRVVLADLGEAAWLARYGARWPDPAGRERARRAWQARIAQFHAVLAAHGLHVHRTTLDRPEHLADDLHAAMDAVAG